MITQQLFTVAPLRLALAACQLALRLPVVQALRPGSPSQGLVPVTRDLDALLTRHSRLDPSCLGCHVQVSHSGFTVTA
jgi:hypothetical protein